MEAAERAVSVLAQVLALPLELTTPLRLAQEALDNLQILLQQIAAQMDQILFLALLRLQAAVVVAETLLLT